MPTTIDYNNLSPSLQTTISQGGGPKITSLDYPGDDSAADPAGGQTISIVGTGFQSGCSIIINGNAVGVVTFVSSTSVTFVSPANSAGSYPLYLVNPDGGTAILVPGIQYSGVPTWTTPAGSLGSQYETSNFNTTLTATADSAVTYSLASGTLPTGATLNANGVITGTSVVTNDPTTYTFTVAATDAELQDTNRQFSITINPDSVTWNSPANNTTYNVFQTSPIANVAMSATSAGGFDITYTADTLPDGLSITGANIAGTPTTLGNTTSVLTATATSTRSANRTIYWVVSVANDPSFSYVTAQFSADNSVNTFVDDASTNSFAITINGDTKPNNLNPYTPGYYSAYFDGTGDELTWAGTTIGSNQYTVEFWFYNVGAFSGGSGIGLIGTSSGGGFNVRIMNTTTIKVDAYNSSGSDFTVPAMSASQWYHLVVCRNSSNQTTVFLNGTRSSTGAATISTSYSSASRIGASQDLTNFNGYISNVRLVVGSTVYDPTQSTITVPTAPLTAIANTSLLTCQSNRLIDNSTNNFTIGKAGDTFVSGFDPFILDSNYATYGSTYFDGSGDYLSVPDNTALRLSSTDFTIEFWAYQTSLPTTVGYFNKGNDYGLDNDANRFVMRVGGGNTFVLNGSLDLNIWTHLALVRNGGTITLYKNGVVVGSASSPTISDSSSALFIGYCSVGSGAYFPGYISNFRLVKGTAVYTGAFTPPTAPLTAIANTSLLTCQYNLPVNNNIFIDNSTVNSFVTRNGNTTQGTFSPYGAGWSNYFDGTGDYLTVPSNAAFVVGTGNFTFECWVNTTGAPGGGVTNDKFLFGGFSFTPAFVIFLTNSENKPAIWDGTTQLTSSIAVVASQWTHIAVVRNSGTVTFYVNGVSGGSTSYTTNWTASTTAYIGRNDAAADRNFPGYISNLRFIKGTAVYTSAFTPSTSPLQPIANTSLLTCADNRFVDDSANNFVITRNGDVSIQRFNPFNITTLPSPSYSVYFDGSSDYIRTTGAAMNTSTFTISFYFYPTTASVIGLFDSAPGTASTFRNYPANTIQDQNDGSVAFTPVVNSWNWMSITGSGNTFTVYLNGSSVGSASFSSLAVNNFTIGTINSGGDGSFAGYISNFRIKNVASVDAVPTSPLTAVSGTTYLTCQSSTLIDNSPNNFTITSSGNSQPSQFNPFTTTYATSQEYSTSVIGGSMYFDGTTDYLTVPNNISNQLAGVQYTIEMWLYPTTTGTERRIFNKNAASVFGYVLYLGTANVVGFRTDSLNISNGTIAATTNSWSHVAVTNDGTTTRIFVNGVLSTTANGVTISNDTGNLRIGSRLYDGTFPYTGYISDARIVKGTALYTTNFVPPNIPMTAIQNTTLLLNGTSAGMYDATASGDFESVGDAKINTAVTKFSNTSSMYFDGTGDYLVTYKNTNLYGAPQQFTAECWVYVTNTGVTNGIMGTWNGPSGTTGWTITCTNSFNLRFGSVFFNSTWYYNGLGSISANTWTHIAFVRTLSGTNNRMLFFVNGVGVLDAIDGTSDTRYTGSPAEGFPFAIGAASTATNDRFNNDFGFLMNGYIADVRITRGVARYTSNFTPPTEPYIAK